MLLRVIIAEITSSFVVASWVAEGARERSKITVTVACAKTGALVSGLIDGCGAVVHAIICAVDGEACDAAE